MCVSTPRKVISIKGTEAVLEDGRVVRLAGVSDARVGEYLEVYADVALGKIDPLEAQDIQKAQMKKGTDL